VLHSKTKISTLVVAGILTLSGCFENNSSSEGPDFNPDKNTNTDFNQQALVENLTDNIITPVFTQFAELAENQAAQVEAYCNVLDEHINGQGSAENATQALNSAQQAWRDAMNTWQEAEVMLLGPLVEDDNLLRNKLYSWPTTNSCSVDYDVVFYKNDLVNGQPYDITKRTPSRKGMAALEYLLFNDNTVHACDPSAPPPEWNTFDDNTIKLARCAFAGEVARDVHNNASSLVNAWTASDGYANQLKQAGSTTSSIAEIHDAVNRISDAMFYLDSVTKDEKLATPLGIFQNECNGIPCQQEVESPYAHHSLSNIYHNLIGFQKLLTGGDGLGFVDYLNDVGDSATADTMVTDVNEALATILGISGSLHDALANDVASVEQSHADIKDVTDKLKTDFINSLALELPSTAAGDND